MKLIVDKIIKKSSTEFSSEPVDERDVSGKTAGELFPLMRELCREPGVILTLRDNQGTKLLVDRRKFYGKL